MNVISSPHTDPMGLRTLRPLASNVLVVQLVRTSTLRRSSQFESEQALMIIVELANTTGAPSARPASSYTAGGGVIFVRNFSGFESHLYSCYFVQPDKAVRGVSFSTRFRSIIRWRS
jgi:hypothetical protein